MNIISIFIEFLKKVIMAIENYNTNSLLQQAIEENNLEKFKRHCSRFMINTNLNLVILNQIGFSLFTPLIYACRLGSFDIVDYLLNSNLIILDAIDNYGQNALMNSIHSRSPSLFRHIAMLIPINSMDNEENSCLHIAASIGELEILRICIEECQLNNSKNIHGQTPLHVAESLDVIEYLVVQNFNVNEKDSKGWTVLHYAVYKELQDCVRLLLQIGVDIMIKNDEGLNCLEFAKTNSSNLLTILEPEYNKKAAEVKKENFEFFEDLGILSLETPKKIGKYHKSLENKEKLRVSLRQPESVLKMSNESYKQENLRFSEIKEILSEKSESNILEVNSEGEEFYNVEPLIQTPLVTSEMFKKNSSTDSVKTQKTLNIQNMLSETLLKTPSDTFSLSDLGVEIAKYKELQLRELLGKGAYGNVHRGYFRNGEVAIKIINHDKLDDRVAKEFIKEIEILVKIRHTRFLSLLAVCIEGPLCIITELSKGGNLALAIENNILSTDEKIKIASEIAEGILHIHSKNPAIVHRDLKPQNILLDKFKQVKIGDLGLSRAIEKISNTEKINSTRVCAGTVRYMAPELYYEEPICNKATDVWAFGCVLFHLFTGTPPWHGLENTAVQRRLILKQPFICNFEAIPAIEDLIKRCCDIDPDNRIGFEEINRKLLEILGIQNSQQS